MNTISSRCALSHAAAAAAAAALTGCAALFPAPPPPPLPPTVTTGSSSLACDGSFTSRFSVTNNFANRFTFRFASAGNTNVDPGAAAAPASASIAAGASVRVDVTGRATNPCNASTVNLSAATAGLPAGTGAVTIGALPATATWPAMTAVSGTLSFSYPIVATCCPVPPGTTVNVNLSDNASTGVQNLRINPSTVTCPGGPHNVGVTGQLAPRTDRGIISIGLRAGTGQQCLMRTVAQ